MLCIYCGEPLDGGEYTMPWEDGDNMYGYTICPHCKKKNIEEDDDQYSEDKLEHFEMVNIQPLAKSML